ncbi:MAG: hypothetical protein ABI137_09605 [Antricoccus sp.]
MTQFRPASECANFWTRCNAPGRQWIQAAYKAEVGSPYREATLDEKLHADVVSLTFTDPVEMDYVLKDLVDRANTNGILIEGSTGEVAEGARGRRMGMGQIRLLHSIECGSWTKAF